MSWVKTQQLPKVKKNPITPEGNNNLSFELACDQVMHLKTMANLCVSQAYVKEQLK